MAIWFIPQTCDPAKMAIWFIPQTWLFDLYRKHDMHPTNMRVTAPAYSIWSDIFESSFESSKMKLVCRSLLPCFSNKRLRAFSCELWKDLSKMSLECNSLLIRWSIGSSFTWRPLRWSHDGYYVDHMTSRGLLKAAGCVRCRHWEEQENERAARCVIYICICM